MFRLRGSHLLLLSCLPIAARSIAQTAQLEDSKPTVERLQQETNELRQEIRELKASRTASPGPVTSAATPVDEAVRTEPGQESRVATTGQFKAYDSSATIDWMPSQYITWRIEYNYRASSVPYLSGPGGVTSPGGTGQPGSVVPGWAPDLRRSEQRATAAILVKF